MNRSQLVGTSRFSPSNPLLDDADPGGSCVAKEGGPGAPGCPFILFEMERPPLQASINVILLMSSSDASQTPDLGRHWAWCQTQPRQTPVY